MDGRRDVVASQDDLDKAALCMWREARGEGIKGMCLVAWVIRNRCLRRNTTPAVEVMRPWQFSSMTDPNDPQVKANKNPGDPAQRDSFSHDDVQIYDLGRVSAETILRGALEVSPIGAATMYYSDTIPFPAKWDKSKLVLVAKVGHHRFYIEK